MRHTIILTILDGWGIGKQDSSNPIHSQDPSSIKFIKSNFPNGSLQSSGISVGLPWEEKGNSETGHLNIGAGKIVYQNYPKISITIRNGSFFKNQELIKIANHVKKNNGLLHLVGLVSNSNSESSLEHIKALLTFASDNNLPFKVHLIADGKNSTQKISELIKKIPLEESKISSLSGRFYGCDMSENWDHTAKSYRALIGESPSFPSLTEAVHNSYNRNLTDNFIEPCLINEPNPVKDNDAIIFWNFSESSLRQLSMPFVNPEFSEFPVKPLRNILCATMTNYESGTKALPIFKREQVLNPLGKVLADNDKTVIKIGETIKYNSLTYFLNGFQEKPFKNEYRVLIPSEDTPKPDQNPAMRAKDITARAIQSITENVFDLIVVNYANADIIASTGNLNATEQAVKTIDEEINKLIQSSLTTNATLIITGSHGHIERMIDPMTGIPETGNTKNPVPIYIINNRFRQVKDLHSLDSIESLTVGILSDIAPTILNLLQIQKPSEMTGKNLLSYML